jgi:hypothetical protein
MAIAEWYRVELLYLEQKVIANSSRWQVRAKIKRRCRAKREVEVEGMTVVMIVGKR